MWWKVYFWILVVFTAIGILVLLPTMASWNLASWEGVIESLLLPLGLYCYVFNKKVFSKNVWKYIFYAILIIWIADLVYYLTKLPVLNFLETSFPLTIFEVVLSMLIGMPAFVSIYRLAFSAKKKK